MILLVFEGFNDLQFFKSFLIKIEKYNDCTNNNPEIETQFKKLLQRNPGRARIDILEHQQNDKVVLVSIGGKQYFNDIAEASKPLVTKLEISKILLIGDKDAEKEILSAKDKMLGKGLSVQVETVTYSEYLEDLILNTMNLSHIPQKDKEVLEKMFQILSENYLDGDNESTFKKRKTSIVHAIIGPRCWGHLFDELFNKFQKKDINEIPELDKIIEFLKP